MRLFLAVLLLLLSFGPISLTYAKADKKNIQSYPADLDADSRNKVVEVEDKYPAEGVFVLSVRERNKTKDIIDSLLIPGKIIKLELVDFDYNGFKKLVVHFDGPDKKSNIAVYQFKNNKLYKIFSATSEYGLDTEFQTIPKIKVGKASKRNNISTFMPAWDTWVWVGGKFIKE